MNGNHCMNHDQGNGACSVVSLAKYRQLRMVVEMLITSLEPIRAAKSSCAPNQFCNLSEVVVRDTDTMSSLMRKVRLATILGTLQSSLTDFRYLRPIWKRNTEEECLLGVSLTGIMDNKCMSGGNGVGQTQGSS